jgi:hypothetical protein
MVEKRRVISLLPAVNQTDTLTKFFSATVDHLFQPESVEFLSGYIGSKPPYYNAKTDFYVGEPTKSRQDYQLPVTAISANTYSGKVTNIMFYHDFVNSLQFQGAVTANQTRLFEQEYYSWSPPIDPDKLINFTKYYWVPVGPAPILLLNPTNLRQDAVGKPHYTYQGAYQLTGTGEIKVGSLVFSTGLVVTPTADATGSINGTAYIINNVGRSIQLLTLDGFVDPNWDTRGWDTQGWDGDASIYVKDYTTIGRGPNPSNQWSANNRWFHEDVLLVSGTGTFPPYQTRAARPIIEFDYDLQLYNSGNRGRPSVTLIASDIADVMGTIVGQTSYTINGLELRDGYTLLVTGDADPLVNNRVYQVGGLSTLGVITLTLVGGAPAYGDAILVRYGTVAATQTISYTAPVQYWYDGTAWKRAQQRVPSVAPLFNLYDQYGNALDDPSVYPSSTFAGNSIFTYALDQYAVIDTELGIQIKLDQFGDYVFNNTLVTDTYTYVSDGSVIAIPGFAYYRNNASVAQYNNAWYKSPVPSRQYIVNDFTVNLPTAQFTIDQVPDPHPGPLPSIYVYLIYGGSSHLLVNDIDYTVSANVVILTVPALSGQRVLVRSWNGTAAPINTVGYYELPLNLTANPDNEQVGNVGYSQFLQQFSNIIGNQPGLVGNALGNNNWRDTSKIRGLGLSILQHKAPMIKPMILSSGNITVGINTVMNHTEPMQAMQYAQNQYVRFYNRFIQSLYTLSANGFTANQQPSEWVSTALRQINLGKTPASPWANSGPDGPKAGYTYLRSTAPTWVPPTGTRLGITKAYIPTVYIQGSDLWIQCHDGARFVMAKDGLPLGSISYGLTSTSDPLLLTDPVAGAWLQFELDLFNNMPDAYSDPQAIMAFDITAYTPGRWRQGNYTRSEFLQVTYPIFDRWVITYQADYRANSTYDVNDPFTWNYSNLRDSDGGLVPGYWQGIYRWYYDTDRPHLAPWEMLGFSQQPPWWTEEYGPAPYTRGNTYMWSDLAAGRIRQGPRAGIYLPGVRPGLLSCIPVDAQGKLLPPTEAGCVVGLPSVAQAAAPWVYGDGSPVESVWIYSNEYTFVTAQYSYLMKPAQFIEYNWDTLRQQTVFADQPTAQTIYIDTDNRRPNNQLYVHRENPSAIGGNLNIPNESTLSYYGSGGVQHWITEYIVGQNLNVTQYFGSIVRGTVAQLAHQAGGFVTSNLYLTADSFGQIGYTSQIIPSENVKTYLYKSASIRESYYSGVILTQVKDGWRVVGYDAIDQFFTIIPSNKYGSKTTIVVGNDRVYWYKVGVTAAQQISYGTVFNTKQEVFDFLISLQRYQEFQGFMFDQYNSDGNTTLDWLQAGREFLLWSQGNWANGNFIALSPLAIQVKYVQPFGTVQFVNGVVGGTYPVIDKLGQRIDGQNLEVLRYDDTITVTANGTQNIYGMRLFANTLESVLVLDNRTSFDDTVYDPIYNLYQPRLRLYAYRTNDWDGRVDAPGFFLYQAGADNQWTLVTNFEKTANDFTKYFNIDQPKNHETIDPVTGNAVIVSTELAAVDNQVISDLSKHQIGYQHRPYLANLLLEESTEFQFYQGFIKQKGTLKAFDAILRNQAIVPPGSTYEYYEEYALRTSRFGSTAINTDIDFIIPQNQYINDPQQIQVFGLQGNDRELNGVITLIPHDPLILVPPISYSNENDPLFPLRTTTVPNYTTDLPTAGYVLIGETTFTAANTAVLSTFWETQNIAGNPIVNGDTVWQFIDNKQTWDVWKFSTANVNIVNTTPSIVTGQPTVINCSGNVGLKTGDLVVLDGISNVTALQGSFYVGNIVGDGRSFTIPVNTFTIGAGGNITAYKSTRFSTVQQRDHYPPLNGWQPGDISYVDVTDYGINGWTVYQYLNNSWIPIRAETYDVDASLMLQAKLYSESRGTVYTYPEYYDPAKGFIPSEARKNLDRISLYDPASYNTGNVDIVNLDPQRSWGPEHIGETWWNLSSVRYLDYEISSNAYRWQNWGKIAPGTSVDVYEWVQSPVSPTMWASYVANQQDFTQFGINYTPTGTVYNSSDPAYTQVTAYNANGVAQSLYYFWVAGATTLPLPAGRSVTTVQISKLLTNPNAYGLPWYAAIDARTIVVSGIGRYLSGTDTVLSLLYTHKTNQQIDYKQYDLVRAKDPDSIPEDFFWLKLKDSLTGKDGQDENVPDPYLSDIMRYGTLIRPRQSWFKYRVIAAETYVAEANKLLGTILLVPDINRGSWVNYFYRVQPPPSSDYNVGTLSSMYALGGTIPSGSTITVLAGPDTQNLWKQYQYQFNDGKYLYTELAVQAYNTPNYWYYVDWYLPNSGVTSTTVVNYTVPTDADRTAYQGVNGLLVKVLNRGDGYWSIYEWIGTAATGSWVTVGYQNGTIQISTGVYDGSINTMLFGTTPFDSTGFDIFPHVEFGNIIDGLRYAIFNNPNPAVPGESVYLNQLFFAMIDYVLVEQGFVDWLFKTSFIYLRGFNIPLTTSQLYQPDYGEALLSYLNEVKPYHAKIRQFVNSRSWNDNALISTTDFDNPSNASVTTNIAYSSAAWEQNYLTNPELIRTLKIKMLFDRVSSVARGWDRTSWSSYGWDATSVPSQGAFHRIQTYYAPTADMIRKDDPALIPGADFRGIIMDALGFTFAPGWQLTPWDSPTGWDAGEDAFTAYHDILVQGGIAPEYDKYFGTGNRKVFTLSRIPQDPAHVVVWADSMLSQYGVDWVIPNSISGLQLVSAGQDYQIGDQLYLEFSPVVAPTNITVTGIDDQGGITAWTLNSSGSYDIFTGQAIPVAYQPYSMGTGSGASFSAVWSGNTLVFYTAPSSNASPNVFVLYVGTTFLPAPTGPLDIVNDGNNFIEPYVQSDHPEELYTTMLPWGMRIDTYQQPVGGSPLIYMRIYQLDGQRDHFPLGIAPMDQSAVIAQIDGKMLTYGLENDFVINWTTNTMVFLEAPTGVSLQILTIGAGGSGTGIVSPKVVSYGIGYQPGDVVYLAGGVTVNNDAASVQVTAVRAAQITIVSGGTGYVLGDVLVLQPDSDTSAISSLELTVTNVITSTGTIVSASITQSGAYKYLPADTVFLTNGTGTGAEITVDWGVWSVIAASQGTYSLKPDQPIAQSTSSGYGLGATFDVLWSAVKSTNTYTASGSQNQFVIDIAPINNDANLLLVTSNGQVLNASNSDIAVNGKIVTITPTPTAGSTVSITVFSTANYSVVNDQEIVIQYQIYSYALNEPPASTLPPYLSTTVAYDGYYLRGPQMDVYSASGYNNSFPVSFVPPDPANLLVYVQDYLQTYNVDYVISGNNVLFNNIPIANEVIAMVVVDPLYGYNYLIGNQRIDLVYDPPVSWNQGYWDNYFGWDSEYQNPTAGSIVKVITYSEDVSYQFRTQTEHGPCYPNVPGNTPGTYVLITPPYDDSTLMVWLYDIMQTLLYDYSVITVDAIPGWGITPWQTYGWQTEYSGDKAVVFAPGKAVLPGDAISMQYMTALPERLPIAWRTITTGDQTTSTVISDANKTILLSTVYSYSTSIEVLDDSVLDQPTDTQPGTIWIGDERIDYWMVEPAPVTAAPKRAFLTQLIRGTYNTPSGNVTVGYDTIFYDGNGTQTYFPTASGTLPPGGNVAVFVGNQIQVDSAINSNVGTYTIAENPQGQRPGTYVFFAKPPAVGWRNVRLSSPRSEVSVTSQISHVLGSTVLAAGTAETIPGGYQWIAAPNGLQYASSSLARFLLEHSGTRT